MASRIHRDGYRAGWLDASLGMSNNYAIHGSDSYASGYRLGQSHRNARQAWQEAYYQLGAWPETL